MAAPRPYGTGPYGTGPYSRGTGAIELGGVAVIAFSTQAEMALTWQPSHACGPGTWQQPAHVCEPGAGAQPSYVCEQGAWTLTTLPEGPPNKLELVA